MTEFLLTYVIGASGLLSTVYGFGELSCGDIGSPRSCSHGAITASGEVFDPGIPSAAIFLPANVRVPGHTILLRVENGPCKRIRLNDKGAPRYTGVRGFDLSPAAVRLLTGKEPTKHWSGVVHFCQQARSLHEVYRNLNYHPLIDVGPGIR